MAASNSILKLQVDDKQYEASIKSAQNGMQALMETLRKSGKSFNDVDKQTQQYVQELGKMETRATTARGRIGELSSAFVELSQVEKQLTNQERQGTVGKALTESLEQLKKRTIEAKQELADLKKQIDIQPMPEIKMDGKSGGGDMFGGMTAVFGGNMMTKATETMMQLGSHIVDVTKRSMELAKQAEGIKIAFARLNDPTLLDNLRKATHGTVNDLELMKAAVKFNDFNLPVEQLGTMLAFAQKKAKDTGQSVDYMVDSIVTGLGRKSLMILDNLGLSASEVKDKMKETGDMTTAVGEIIKKQMSEAGGYVETAADRAAQSAAQVDNAMLELGEQIAKTFNGKSIDEMKNQLEVGLIKTLSSVIKEVDDVAEGFDFLIEKVDGWGTAVEVTLGPVGALLEGIKRSLDGIGFSGSSAFGALAKAIQYSVNPLKSIWGMLKMIGIATKNISEGGVDVGGSLGSVIANLGKKPEVPQYTPPTPKSTKSGGGGKTSSAKTSGKPTTAQTIEKAEQVYYNAWMKAAQDMTAGIIKGDEYGKQVNAAQYKLAEAYRKAYEATGNEKYLKSFEDTATEANTFRDALKDDAEQTKKQAEQKKKLQEAEDAYKKALESADYGEIRKTGEALSKLQATSLGVVEGDGVSVYSNQNRGAKAAYAASNNSMASLGGYISDLQADLKNADLGSAVYDSLTARLQDATLMQGVLTQLMDEGMKGADLQEAANELKTKLLAGDIDEAAWEDFVARVNEKLEEQGFDPIKIDIETGKVSKDIKATWQDAAKAVESVGSAMSQIEDPAAKVMGTVAQAIASVALGAAEAIKQPKPWPAWIAFAAAATATMISTISTIHSATGYAQGGIVDGTQGGFVGGTAYSGDNVGNVRLDSGELVLSRAQQSSLAAELEGNPMQNLELSTRISGRFLEIAINNDSRSRSRGKLVTSTSRT